MTCRDRAAVVADAIVMLVRRSGLTAALRDEIAKILREEFYDVQRQTHDEVKPSD